MQRWKYIFLLDAMLFSSALVFGQSMEPFALTTAGQSWSKDDFTLDWSIGETNVRTLSNGADLLSQGLHQPDFLLSIRSTIDPLACGESSTGRIDISVNGGYPPYSYLWSNGQTSEDIDNLNAGFYFVTVTDLIHSIQSDTFQITSNDLYEHAYHLINTTNWCSSLASFCNIGATPDMNTPACWSQNIERNVWFKFVAESEYIQVSLNTLGSEGSLELPMIALLDESLETELACASSENRTNDLAISSVELNIGETYYLMVDNQARGNNLNEGSFTLCISDSANYDFKDGALDVTDSLSQNDGSWTSALDSFDNSLASPDMLSQIASCWNPARKEKNLWFKFTAQRESVVIFLTNSESDSSIAFPRIALWNDQISQELACGNTSQAQTVRLQESGLTIGTDYFVEVDSRNNGNNDNSGYFGLYIETNPSILTAVENSRDSLAYRVFPNPSSNGFTIESNKRIMLDRIEMIDLSGKLMETMSPNSNLKVANKWTFEFSAHQVPGTYVLRIYHSTGYPTFLKLLIE